MRKKVSVAPAPELELEFEDGKSLLLIFNMKAISHINDFEDGLKTFMLEKSQAELCAKVIFIASVENNIDFTIEKARMIVANMSPASVTEIMLEFNESVGSTKNEVLKELQKKMMQEFLLTKN